MNLVQGLVCPTVYILVSVAPGVGRMNVEDYKNMRIAEGRCRTVIGERAPCLKKFTKTGELEYTAICGKKDK